MKSETLFFKISINFGLNLQEGGGSMFLNSNNDRDLN